MNLKKKAFENIEGKEENAGYQHFHLFPQCFLHLQNAKPFTTQSKLLTLKNRGFENIEGKGENGYQHFLLFPQCFQMASFFGLLKLRTMWSKVKPIFNSM